MFYSTIFELIKGEMAYVEDLENIEYVCLSISSNFLAETVCGPFQMYVQDPPIIPRDRSATFIRNASHNYGELHAHHKRLLDQSFDIQREEHPITITAPMYDAVLNGFELQGR